MNNDIICTAGGVPNPQDKPFIAEFVKTHVNKETKFKQIWCKNSPNEPLKNAS